MKKQTAVVVSFSALLTLSAFAPKVLWQEKHSVNRFPASEEAITPPKKSLYEMREMDKHLQEKIEVKKEEAQVSCLKDQQPSALEEEIKKLMADKEAIMKEIADLKKDKKEEPTEDKKEKKEVARFTEKEDFVTLISQMTSLMVSQQQQQQMIMEQMFSMMSQMQMPQNKQNFMSPYSFEQSYPQAYSAYPELSTLGYNVGISYGPQASQEAQAYQNPYAIQLEQSQMRAPSAQYEPAFLPRSMSVQPQLQSQYMPGNYGFDFSNAHSSYDMERVQF